MVAVPPGQQAVHSVAGAGANAASAFILPTVSARGVTDAQLTKWKIAFHENNTKLIMNVRRAIAASGNEPSEENTTSYGQVITECTAEMEAISTSIAMLPYVDPTFQSLTPSCPLLASDAKSAMVNSKVSTPFLTYNADASYDPSETHWLAQLRHDFEREARWHHEPAPAGGRARCWPRPPTAGQLSLKPAKSGIRKRRNPETPTLAPAATHATHDPNG